MRRQARRPAPGAVSDDTRLAIDIRGLVESGEMDEARERFSGLVAAHQRRASRIAYQYLRDAAEADEAVQDAFIKAFSHLTSYRRGMAVRSLAHPHSHQWMSRPSQGACSPRPVVRAGRRGDGPQRSVPAFGGAGELDPEARLLARERRARLAAAINRLDGRQRSVFMLCHFGDCTPREVSAMTGLNESTVRVHLFRAARKLRGFLGGKP